MQTMRLTHFALALTVILLGITGYLAWEGQQEIKGLKRERDFERQQRVAEQAASPDESSLIPLPTSITPPPPPAPGTIAPAPAPARVVVADEAPMAGASMLPGAGLTVPKSVADAEAKGISTNTLTPIQQHVAASLPVASVKLVVREQGFIIIDAGSNKGFVKGQKLEIRRANSVIGRVTLTDSIEAAEAVADLDLSSIPTGVTIEPGDQLIAPVAR
jgi:hypothetical protein